MLKLAKFKLIIQEYVEKIQDARNLFSWTLDKLFFSARPVSLFYNFSSSLQERAKWESMMPVEEMNLEEALEAVPHLVVNPNKPSMWPHDRDYDEWVAELKANKVDGGH